MGVQEPGRWSPARTVLIGVFVALLVYTIVLILATIPAGFYAVFSGHLSKLYSYFATVYPYFWIGPAVAYVPIPVSVGVWFSALTAIYVAFLVYSMRQGRGPLKAMAASFNEGIGALMSSPFLVTIIAIAFLTFTASIADSLISTAGVPIGSPSGDPLALLVGFTAAPLAEELGFRVFFIGVVALILSMGRPWKQALGALWRPSKALEGLAIGSGAAVIIWVATAFSAVTFGACHVICGGTWEPGKVIETTYAGVVLGYLYIKYGFHVAVLAHWGVDFAGSAFAFFGQAAYGISWASSSSEFFGQYLVDLDMLSLFGVASFILVMYLVVTKLATRGHVDGTGGFDKGRLEGGTVQA